MNTLPTCLRPREKLLSHGVRSLTDVELLALLLRNGQPGMPVLNMADGLIQRYQGLAGLLHASAQDLQNTPGLGPAKSAELVAVMELARRCLEEPLRRGDVMHDPETVGRFVQAHLGRRSHEVFAVIFVDSQHRLLHMEEMFRGTLAQASVYPREVVQRALQLGAAAVVLAHNHPSGCQEPSPADWHLTDQLQQALRLIDVQVLDHLVVTAEHWTSLRQQGWLPRTHKSS